jgi:hypothetical protein
VVEVEDALKLATVRNVEHLQRRREESAIKLEEWIVFEVEFRDVLGKSAVRE